MEWLTTTDVANEWGISSRQVQMLCDAGRIEGVQRFGRMWMIPSSAPRPDDGRKNRRRVVYGY